MSHTRNTALFDAIADQIEREPKSYDQMCYAVKHECGTAHCVAGHALALSGIPLDDDADIAMRAEGLLGLEWPEADKLFAHNWKPPTGETVPQALRRIGRGGAI